MYKIHNDFPGRIRGLSLPTPQMYTHTILEILSWIIMSPDRELSLQKGAYTTEDLFCRPRFPQRLKTCQV